MKFTVPHGIASVFCGLAALLPVLQTVAPAAVPGPTGIAIAGGVGLAATIGHAVWDSIKADVVVKCVPLLLGLVAAGAVAPLSGCASTQAALNTPTAQVLIATGVRIAVDTAESKGVTAAQINAVAKAVLAADQGVSTSLAALTGVVNTQVVKLGIPPGDLEAFKILEDAFDAWLVQKYGAGNATTQNVQADVAAFCNTVIADTGG